MTGIVPVEGRTLALSCILKNADVNRGTNFKLGLFTNSSGLDVNSVLADITQPAGTGYAEIDLTDGSWAIAAGVGSYAQQVFTMNADWTGGNIYGFYIRSTGTAPKLAYFEISGRATDVPLSNKRYTVTPVYSLADGGAGILSDEGLPILLDKFLNNVGTLRGTNLLCGLYTNASGLSNASVYADLTQYVANGAAVQTLVDGTWSVTAGSATYAIPAWTATADWTSDIYGVFVAMFDGTSTYKLLALDPNAASPISLVDTGTYDYDLVSIA